MVAVLIARGVQLDHRGVLLEIELRHEEAAVWPERRDLLADDRPDVRDPPMLGEEAQERDVLERVRRVVVVGHDVAEHLHHHVVVGVQQIVHVLAHLELGLRDPLQVVHRAELRLDDLRLSLHGSQQAAEVRRHSLRRRHALAG